MSTVAEQPDVATQPAAAPKAMPDVTITPKASDEVRRIMADQGVNEPLYLRLRVVGGGCSGFQHELDLDRLSTRSSTTPSTSVVSPS